MIACCFTGHRPMRFKFKFNESDELCKKIKQAIFNECFRLYQDENVRDFYTGCALGVDIWGAEAVIKLKNTGYQDVRLICALPYPNHTERWGSEQVKRLEKILIQADDKKYVRNFKCDEAYKLRNYYMVDNSQFVMAVFDNKKNIRSGTLQTLNYSIKEKRRIILIHPDTADIYSM